MTILYIDVSHYDWERNRGNLNWPLIKSSGIDVVFIRASYGDPVIFNPETRYFKELATEAKKAGLRVGGYHNLINGDFPSIQRQVTYFREQLNSVPVDYAMVDVEPYDALKLNNLWPRLPAAEIFAQEFRNQDDGNRKLAVYLAQWVWSGYLKKADLTILMSNARGPLINSNYPLGTTKGVFTDLYSKVGGDTGKGWVAYGNVVPGIWQFSSNASVPGASSVTDVNAFKGTLDELDEQMAWVLTKNLDAFRDQMNLYFPHRDKTSDGTIGDAAHSAEHSGHNPDDTEYDNAEWDSDSDTKSEVRAIDIDNNTGDPDVSMEDILQHLLKLAKSDSNFPIRYMIYNKRIYRVNNGWAKETYTGPSPHTEHIHLSGGYSNTADENVYNYRLDELVALSEDDKTWLKANIPPAFRNYAALSDTDVNKIANAILNSDSIPGYDENGNLLPEVTGDAAANDMTVRTALQRAARLATQLSTPKTQEVLDRLRAENAEIVPTSIEVAAAVVAALGADSTLQLADILKGTLTAEQLAALKAAL